MPHRHSLYVSVCLCALRPSMCTQHAYWIQEAGGRHKDISASCAPCPSLALLTRKGSRLHVDEDFRCMWAVLVICAVLPLLCPDLMCFLCTAPRPCPWSPLGALVPNADHANGVSDSSASQDGGNLVQSLSISPRSTQVRTLLLGCLVYNF